MGRAPRPRVTETGSSLAAAGLSVPKGPSLCAIVPARDAASYLLRSLPALRAALPPGAEPLVVDDGSRDETAAVAASAGARVVRHATSRGPAAARNSGAREARGEVLLFLDADCVPHEDAVLTLLRALDDPEVAAAFGSYDDRPEVRSWVSLYKNLAHHFVHQRSPGEASTFWAGFGVVRRAAFLGIGGFDESYRRSSIEDVELGYRLKAAGHRIRLVREAQVGHLKRWTLRSWLESDLRDRAIPWGRLLRRGHRLPRGLNFTGRDRAAAALVGGAGLCLLASAAAPLPVPFLITVALLLASALLLDAPFLRFAARRGSLAFAMAAGGLQLVHRAVGLAGLVLGLLLPRKTRQE